MAHRLLAAPLGRVQPTAEEGLGQIGAALDVPWLQLHLLVDSGRAVPVCEWRDPRGEPRFSAGPQLGFTFDEYPWLIERTLRMEPLQIYIDELPAEAAAERARLKSEGVQWLLVLPSGDSRGPRGGMVLHDDRRREFLDEGAVALLMLGAGLFVQALERERAEQALVRSERRFRTLAEATTEAVLVQSEGIVIDVNDAACRLFERARSELLGARVPDDLVGEEVVEEVRRRVESRFEGTYATTIRTAGGARVPVEASGRHLDLDGRNIRIVAIRDISERKQAERQLRESADRLRALLEAAFEGFVVSRRGFVLDANEGFARMCGYELSEVIGMMPTDVTTKAGAATILKNIEAEVHVPYVVTGVRKDGTTFPMEIQGTECYFDGERVRITGFRDLTREYERDRLEERVRQAQKLESLGVLAGGIAHDFNNLLVGILGNADVAAEAQEEGSEGRVAVDRMRTAAIRAAEMVRQMLAYAGRAEMTGQAIALGPLVQEMRDLMRGSLPPGVQVEEVFAPDLPPVRGDSVQLRQVVMNLLTNAAEAARDAGGHVRMEASVARVKRPPTGLAPSIEMRPGRYVRLAVIDDGSGMDAEVRAKMFDPFFSTKFTGRGLGLAAVLGILRSHSGGIAVRSEPGRGTTVEIYLPIAEPVEAPDPAEISTRTTKSKVTVLLVDDEELVRQVATAALERAGHRVFSAPDGAAGLALYLRRAADIDLALLDIAMPGFSGEELYSRIRARNPHLPVLFSSGYLHSELDEDTRRDPRAGFLQKPYRAAELVSAVARLLER